MDYRTVGGGNIVKGIASALDVTNNTVQVIDGIGSALVDMVTFTGGPSNFVLYIIDLAS